MTNSQRVKTQNAVVRDNEQLWQSCKQEAVEKMGKFSARAMQHAVYLYKTRGGGYVGQKSPDNSLVKWSKNQMSLVDI